MSKLKFFAKLPRKGIPFGGSYHYALLCIFMKIEEQTWARKRIGKEEERKRKTRAKEDERKRKEREETQKRKMKNRLTDEEGKGRGQKEYFFKGRGCSDSEVKGHLWSVAT